MPFGLLQEFFHLSFVDHLQSFLGCKSFYASLENLSTGDQSQAAGFYAEHEGRPFFPNLVEYMTSAPVFVQVLEGDNAVIKNRELMGATNPSKADHGTIRADFAETIDANAVHGSDSIESAAREISYFFDDSEIF